MPAAAALVDLGVLLALVVLVGLRFGYTYSLGRVFILTAALMNTVSIPTPFGRIRLLGFAADALLKADHAIMHALGVGIDATQSAWNECLSYTAQAVDWVGKEIASLSHDTAQAVEGLAVGQVKPWVAKRLAASLAAVAALKARVVALERSAVPHVQRITKVVTHRVTVVEHAIAVPDVGAIPRAIPRIGQLEREAADTLARARALARRLAPAAIAAAVIAALGRLGLGWVRCSKVGRVGRQICGMNESALENLLASTVLIVGTVSLVEFAEGMQGIVGEIETPVRAFWRAV